MSTKVIDLATANVVTATPHQTVEELRNKMNNAKISCIPVVNPDLEVLGVVSSTDVLKQENSRSSVSSFMTTKVFHVPAYEKVEIAARIMRNHHIHHLIVVDDKKLTGIISSFDLLKLIEGKSFVMKSQAQSAKAKGKRKQIEA